MQKVVLVTGGSSGIGQAIAQEFANDPSYKVYATSRNFENGTIRENIHFVQLNIADNSSVESAVKYVLSQDTAVDILINCAGVGFAGPLEHTTTENMVEVFNTNVFGILELTRKFIPGMRAKKNGVIINISSIGGRVALPFRGVYSSSKFALEGLTESLSQELSQFGIKVIIIEPGTFNTNITQNRKTTQFPEDSPYKTQFDHMYKMVNDELAKASKPLTIGKEIKLIAEKESPAAIYAIAPRGQKLPLILKKFLPSRVFEKLIMNHFKIAKK